MSKRKSHSIIITRLSGPETSINDLFLQVPPSFSTSTIIHCPSVPASRTSPQSPPTLQKLLRVTFPGQPFCPVHDFRGPSPTRAGKVILKCAEWRPGSSPAAAASQKAGPGAARFSTARSTWPQPRACASITKGVPGSPDNFAQDRSFTEHGGPGFPTSRVWLTFSQRGARGPRERARGSGLGRPGLRDPAPQRRGGARGPAGSGGPGLDPAPREAGPRTRATHTGGTGSQAPRSPFRVWRIPFRPEALGAPEPREGRAPAKTPGTSGSWPADLGEAPRTRLPAQLGKSSSSRALRPSLPEGASPAAVYLSGRRHRGPGAALPALHGPEWAGLSQRSGQPRRGARQSAPALARSLLSLAEVTSLTLAAPRSPAPRRDAAEVRARAPRGRLVTGVPDCCGRRAAAGRGGRSRARAPSARTPSHAAFAPGAGSRPTWALPGSSGPVLVPRAPKGAAGRVVALKRARDDRTPGTPGSPSPQDPRDPRIPETPGSPSPQDPHHPRTPGTPGSPRPQDPHHPRIPETPGSPSPQDPHHPRTPITPGSPSPQDPHHPRTPITPGPPAPQDPRDPRIPIIPGSPRLQDPHHPRIPETPGSPSPQDPHHPRIPETPGSPSPQDPRHPRIPITPGSPSPQDLRDPRIPETPGSPSPQDPHHPRTPGTPGSPSPQDPRHPRIPITPGPPAPQDPHHPRTPGTPGSPAPQDPRDPRIPETPGSPSPQDPHHPRTPSTLGPPSPQDPRHPRIPITPGPPAPQDPHHPRTPGTPGSPSPQDPHHPRTPGTPGPQDPHHPRTPGTPGTPAPPGEHWVPQDLQHPRIPRTTGTPGPPGSPSPPG
ncbi:collagen alpha-1(III) chain-like [Dipodomys merriami]|uniref:collagen alpha-1(III) chain-like n=1 Tax=Dipodomys merriami TaxID=94247 RepID=UPI003855BBBE